ncbi:MAG: hypothetical protein AAFQ80_15110 [Cyanobacteria bacterium J06621_8]
MSINTNINTITNINEMKAKKTEVLTAYTDKELKNLIVNLASEKEISVSELIIITLKDAIEKSSK